MVKKLILSITIITCFASINTKVMANKQIEIFDIGKGEVIMVVDVNPEIQQKVETFLKGITDINRKLNPIPEEGFMFKIPMEPALMVQNKWFNDLVDEVILMYSGKDGISLIVFDSENRTHFFIFNGDIDTFLREIKFKPEILP